MSSQARARRMPSVTKCATSHTFGIFLIAGASVPHAERHRLVNPARAGFCVSLVVLASRGASAPHRRCVLGSTLKSPGHVFIAGASVPPADRQNLVMMMVLQGFRVAGAGAGAPHQIGNSFRFQTPAPHAEIAGAGAPAKCSTSNTFLEWGRSRARARRSCVRATSVERRSTIFAASAPDGARGDFSPPSSFSLLFLLTFPPPAGDFSPPVSLRIVSLLTPSVFAILRLLAFGSSCLISLSCATERSTG
jgi:hypothetical protein